MFTQNNFALYSIARPEPYNAGYCVRGNWAEHDDDRQPIPSNEWLSNCLAAIDAYNEYEFEE